MAIYRAGGARRDAADVMDPWHGQQLAAPFGEVLGLLSLLLGFSCHGCDALRTWLTSGHKSTNQVFAMLSTTIMKMYIVEVEK